MIITEAECVNLKCQIKLSTFSFYERITRPAEQQDQDIMILEFNKPFDIIAVRHTTDIWAGRHYN